MRKVGEVGMTDREYAYIVSRTLENKIAFAESYNQNTLLVTLGVLKDILALLKEQENEYEKGFNDAMQDKRELMYEGIDGKWHKKDW